MELLVTHANIYRTADRAFRAGDLLVRDGLIARVTEGEDAALRASVGEQLDADGRLLVPGLVDVHTHGRAGGDFTTADIALMGRMAASYLQSGVTTLLPTLASAPLDVLRDAIARINAAAAEEQTQPGTRAHFAGVHLEGRYLNVKKRGAHAPELLAPLDADELGGLLAEIDGVRHVSAALELDTDGAFLRKALEMGATVSMGHTNATYAEAVDCIARGATAMTHLFNAMPPLHHRDGGAVCAGLLDPTVSCELIVDGFHISPEMVTLAYRMKGDHLVLITDSMEATGCADGEYTIAGMPVTVKDGRARTHDGAIAGSTLSLWDGVHNLCDFAAAPFAEAVWAATMAPAAEVGLENEIGSLDEGKRADMLLLEGRDPSAWSRIGQVICGGVCCPDDGSLSAAPDRKERTI